MVETTSSTGDYLNELFGLKGKTALVTGGTRGIGAALIVALASAGADIILLQRDISSGESVKEAVTALGRSCTSYKCDLSKKADVLAIIPYICDKEKREVDILVNCGGVSHRSPAVDYPDDKWDEILQVNLTSGFQLSRALAAHWFSNSLINFTDLGPSSVTNSRKKIINIASVLTFSGAFEVSAYTSSKGAIGQLTKALSNEWMKKGICVNALAPGYIETELTKGYPQERQKAILDRVPAGRWGQPEDMASAIVYLASRGSDFLSGEIHLVDGGYCGR